MGAQTLSHLPARGLLQCVAGTLPCEAKGLLSGATAFLGASADIPFFL